MKKKAVRTIVLIKPDTMGSPLDKMVYTLQLLAFCLTTEKPQIMVQLAMPWILHDNMGVPVTCNPMLTVLLGLDFHEPCSSMERLKTPSLGEWTCCCLHSKVGENVSLGWNGKLKKVLVSGTVWGPLL